MSQAKKLDFSKRVREFRSRAKLSQEALGDRLGVTGNYISMIELGKKGPGPSLQKLFESLEQSPLYNEALNRPADAGPVGQIPPNAIFPILSTETLIKNFAEVAAKLWTATPEGKKQLIGSLRQMLDEIAERLMVPAGGLSEAQQIAVAAAKRGAAPVAK